MPVKREPGEDDFKYDYSWLNYRNFNKGSPVTPRAGQDHHPQTHHGDHRRRDRRPTWTTPTLWTPCLKTPTRWPTPSGELIWGGAQPIDFDPEDRIN